MVHQITVYHRLPIGISKDGGSEYVCRMKCRCSSQPNDKGIKVFNDTLVLAHIVGLVSERKVFFVQLLVFVISSMCFIYNNTIVCINGKLVFLFIGSIEQSLHHTLYGSKLNTCFYFRIQLAKLVYFVDVRKGIEVFYLVIIKVITGLFGQCSSVRQEQDTTETIGLYQTIGQTNGYTSFSRTRSHYQQSPLLSSQYSFLYRLNSIDLIIAET